MVLIADDDEAIRALVRQALADGGWRVLEAGDGAAALAVYERETAAAQEVALVLLDLAMPVMDGRQFAEHYWRLDAGPRGHAPLVVFTAARAPEAEETAARLRADGYLAKPFELDALTALVERCAGRKTIPPGAGGAAPGGRREPALESAGEHGARHGAGASGGDGRQRRQRRQRRQSGHGIERDALSTPGPAPARAAAPAPGPARPLPTRGRGEGLVPRVTGKWEREALAWRRRMDALGTRLATLQREMGQVRSGVAQVSRIEASRRLTREEARWASQLRLESQRLRYELQVVRDEFCRIRDERAGQRS